MSLDRVEEMEEHEFRIRSGGFPFIFIACSSSDYPWLSPSSDDTACSESVRVRKINDS